VTATTSPHRFRPIHWTGRAARSIRPGPPAAPKVEWAGEHLSDRERDLFARMSNPDRRHAIGVAMQVAGQLDEPNLEHLDLDEDRRRAVVAAALLHDVGKSAAGLRTYGRVVATLSGAVGGKAWAEHWQDTAGFTRKVGLYLRYPELGAEQLMVAGSDPWVVAWAREHHRPEEEWTLPVEVGRVLVAADR
jgi:HD domain